MFSVDGWTRVDHEEMDAKSSSWRVQKQWNCRVHTLVLRFEDRATGYHERDWRMTRVNSVGSASFHTSPSIRGLQHFIHYGLGSCRSLLNSVFRFVVVVNFFIICFTPVEIETHMGWFKCVFSMFPYFVSHTHFLCGVHWQVDQSRSSSTVCSRLPYHRPCQRTVRSTAFLIGC